jgi:hypothetical protein
MYMPAKLTKELLGLAGEYAVASELCRRGLYAQLTLGHHKQTDVLVETEQRVLRLSIKAKQVNEWPSVSGLYRPDDFLVLVDFEGKAVTDRPDFYVLGLEDWLQMVAEERKREPRILVDDENRITWPDGWRGVNIRVDRVLHAKEQWHKIDEHVAGAAGL